MGFAAETKKRALIASARHCCVCHRYKGVRVEVHHIIPQSKGGTDEFDNAIVLCFDCHCDAGHYNPHHPRGTKFSKDELSVARDEWYEDVKRNQIEPTQTEEILYCQYVLCRDVDAFGEILARDLTQLPFEKTLLVDNQILSSQRVILNSYKDKIRRTCVSGATFKDLASYCQSFPDARHTDHSSTSFGWYKTLRVPSSKELDHLAERDGVTSHLHRAGIPAEEIAMAVGYSVQAECGGPDDEFGESWFREDFHSRPLWGIFLAATNESNRKVRLRSLIGHLEDKDVLGYRPFGHSGGEPCESPLPIVALPSGTTALIPLGTVLAPFEAIPYEAGITTTKTLREGEGYYQDFSHVTYQTEKINRFHLLGSLHRPKEIALEIDGCSHLQGVHDLNLTNIYILDRNYAVGSCPHIFFLMDNGVCVYGGEIFTGRPDELSVVNVKVPDRAEELIIAELEKERTYLDSIQVESDVLIQNRWLEENDVVKISGVAGKVVTLRGYYALRGRTEKIDPTPSYLNDIVCQFIARQKAKNWVLAPEDLPYPSICHPNIHS